MLAILVALAGCGGSEAPEDGPTKAVRGPGFVFRAPADRAIERTSRSVAVLPADENGVELESVTRFPLVKTFRPSLWPGVVTELDGVADRLATGLAGTVVASEDIRVAGRRGRRYEISYERDGNTLRQRITFVFRRTEEFQLLCRYEDADTPPFACTLLETTFRPL